MPTTRNAPSSEPALRFRAFSLGVASILKTLGHQVQNGHEFLEEELESNPRFDRYLRPNRAALAASASWLDILTEHARCWTQGELFDAGLMLEAVASKLQRLSPGRVVLRRKPEAAMPVLGELIEFQEALVKAVESHLLLSQGMTVHLDAEILNRDAQALEALESSCQPGRFVAISLCQAEDSKGESWRPFWKQVLAETAESPANPNGAGIEDAWLQIAGLMKMFDGDLFRLVDQTGTPSGVLLLIPLAGQAQKNAISGEEDTLRGNETILLVDDEDMIWDVLTDMLQRLGYTVILAGNGAEAVDIYESNPGAIDLVILDMIMPEMDGHTAFFRLRQKKPDAKVLLTSGYVSEENVSAVLQAGAVGFLKKPYRMIDLARKLRSVFAAVPTPPRGQ